MNILKNPVFLTAIVGVLSIVLIPGCIPEIPDIDPPFIQILYPSSGAVVNGTIPVVVAASDDDKVKEIRIYIDGVVVFKTGENFATYTWDTAPIADNLTHYISAAAIDESDNVGYSPVTPLTVVKGQNNDVTPPVVAILHPVGGQVVSGEVNIVAEARDDTGVERVEFYIDGHLEETVTSRPFDYLWDTTPLPDNSQHTIFLRAYDTNNNSSSSGTITVVAVQDTSIDITPPVVSILHPVGGQVVSAEVNIVAEARDDTKVDRVEFYIDGHLEATVSSRPFDYLWDTAQVDSGLHTIFLRAYDTSNNSAASTTITVVVLPSTPGDNQQPGVKILSPDRNRSWFSETDMSSVPIEIEAYDDTGIDRVELYIDGELAEVLEATQGDASQVLRYDWRLDGYGDGLLHSVFVKAFDRENHVGTDIILVRINP